MLQRWYGVWFDNLPSVGLSANLERGITHFEKKRQEKDTHKKKKEKKQKGVLS